MVRPICNTCKKHPCQSNGKSNSGKRLWKTVCRGCHEYRMTGKRYKKKPYHKYSKEYYIYKKQYCEECKFIAIDKCQLDVDHIDGDRKNNDPNNLKTLCANCHRLKTLLNKDCWAKQYRIA